MQKYSMLSIKAGKGEFICMRVITWILILTLRVESSISEACSFLVQVLQGTIAPHLRHKFNFVLLLSNSCINMESANRWFPNHWVKTEWLVVQCGTVQLSLYCHFKLCASFCFTFRLSLRHCNFYSFVLECKTFI